MLKYKIISTKRMKIKLCVLFRMPQKYVPKLSFNINGLNVK